MEKSLQMRVDRMNFRSARIIEALVRKLKAKIDEILAWTLNPLIEEDDHA